MIKEAKIIAIDLGASEGKLFACTLRGDLLTLQEIHRFSNEAIPFYIPDRDRKLEERLFWDDVRLYANIIDGLRIYRREIGDTADSIGIDIWGSDGMFISPDGTPLERMYAYRDHRLDTMIEAVKERIAARRVYEITGIHFQPFNISNQLLWFVQNRQRLLKKGVIFLPAPALFNYYLGGVTEIDSSWASVTQLMNAKSRRWSREILHALGIPLWLMPKIVNPGTILGVLHKPLADSVGLNQAKLIAVGSHDTASAYTAAPVQNPSHALIISSGTWSLVGKLIPKPITTSEVMAMNMSNEGGVGNIRFLKNCMGTWIVQELRRQWRNRDGREMRWEELSHLTSQGRSLTTFIDLDDRSFYNPSNMEEAIAKYCLRTGQPVLRDRATILKAVYESLALKYRMVNDQICRLTGKSTQVIHIVGGGSKNTSLNQMTANACATPVVAGPEEATAVGNAVVQAMGLGVIEQLSEASSLIGNAFAIHEYRPRDSDKWERAYKQFKTVIGCG